MFMQSPWSTGVVTVGDAFMQSDLFVRVLLGLAGAGVGNGERAVGQYDDLEVCAVGGAAGRVGYEVVGAVVAASEPSAVWSIQRSSRPGLSWTVCQASGLPALCAPLS